MQSAQRPSGGGKVLASYKEVTLLRERHAYLVVAEAVDDGHEESLKRGGKMELKLFLCVLCCLVSPPEPRDTCRLISLILTS